MPVVTEGMFFEDEMIPVSYKQPTDIKVAKDVEEPSIENFKLNLYDCNDSSAIDQETGTSCHDLSNVVLSPGKLYMFSYKCTASFTNTA